MSRCFNINTSSPNNTPDPKLHSDIFLRVLFSGDGKIRDVWNKSNFSVHSGLFRDFLQIHWGRSLTLLVSNISQTLSGQPTVEKKGNLKCYDKKVHEIFIVEEFEKTVLDCMNFLIDIEVFFHLLHEDYTRYYNPTKSIHFSFSCFQMIHHE